MSVAEACRACRLTQQLTAADRAGRRGGLRV
jgi:hypothetical protein